MKNEELADKLKLPWEKTLAKNILESTNNKYVNNEFMRKHLLNTLENAETMQEIENIKRYITTGKGLPIIYHPKY